MHTNGSLNREKLNKQVADISKNAAVDNGRYIAADSSHSLAFTLQPIGRLFKDIPRGLPPQASGRITNTVQSEIDQLDALVEDLMCEVSRTPQGSFESHGGNGISHCRRSFTSLPKAFWCDPIQQSQMDLLGHRHYHPKSLGYISDSKVQSRKTPIKLYRLDSRQTDDETHTSPVTSLSLQRITLKSPTPLKPFLNQQYIDFNSSNVRSGIPFDNYRSWRVSNHPQRNHIHDQFGPPYCGYDTDVETTNRFGSWRMQSSGNAFRHWNNPQTIPQSSLYRYMQPTGGFRSRNLLQNGAQTQHPNDPMSPFASGYDTDSSLFMDCRNRKHHNHHHHCLPIQCPIPETTVVSGDPTFLPASSNQNTDTSGNYFPPKYGFTSPHNEQPGGFVHSNLNPQLTSQSLSSGVINNQRLLSDSAADDETTTTAVVTVPVIHPPFESWQAADTTVKDLNDKQHLADRSPSTFNHHKANTFGNQQVVTTQLYEEESIPAVVSSQSSDGMKMLTNKESKAVTSIDQLPSNFNVIPQEGSAKSKLDVNIDSSGEMVSTLTNAYTKSLYTDDSGIPTCRNERIDARTSPTRMTQSSSKIVTYYPSFVKANFTFWYKPKISRESAVRLLRDKPTGSFIIRDSVGYPGAYGLALKVDKLPPHVQIKSGDDPANELVRHYLIEPTEEGVRLKGCTSEPTYVNLSALVYHHSLESIALPCQLIIPEMDCEHPKQLSGHGGEGTVASDQSKLQGSDQFQQSPVKLSSKALLERGAACHVIYLMTTEIAGSASEHSYIETCKNAISELYMNAAQSEYKINPTIVHFRVSSKGITLTDVNKRVFFRRHYAVESVLCACVDPIKDRCWTLRRFTDIKMLENPRCFGFVTRTAKKQPFNLECHLFIEYDARQPAAAIVNFINKVMLSVS